MKVNVSVTLEENLRNRVAELASVEERSFSAMFALLAERGLKGGVATVTAEPFSLPSSPPLAGSGGASKAESVPSKPVSKRAGRTGKCDHRLDPDTYCKYCDGGE